MPFLRSKVFRWTRRRRSWIERSQNSFVAVCVARLQTALEMPYQKISDRFVAVGIPWCNATASFRVVKVDSLDLRSTTLWMRVFLCGESLVYSRDPAGGELLQWNERWPLWSWPPNGEATWCFPWQVMCDVRDEKTRVKTVNTSLPMVSMELAFSGKFYLLILAVLFLGIYMYLHVFTILRF